MWLGLFVERAMAAINNFWTLTRHHGRAAKRVHSSLERAVRAFIQGRDELEGVMGLVLRMVTFCDQDQPNKDGS